MEWYVEMVTITRFWQHHTNRTQMAKNGMNQDAFNAAAEFSSPCWFRDLIFDGVETRESRYFYFPSFSSYCSFIFMNQLMGHLVGLKSR